MNDRTPIPGVEGYYADSCGMVYQDIGFGIFIEARTRICRGYRYLSVGRMGTKQKHFRVARLIAKTFHGLPNPESLMARHLNDIKTDDRADNLAWGTGKQNVEDAIRNGKRNPPTVGILHGMHILNEDDVLDIRFLLFSGAKACRIAELYGVSRALVTLIKKRKLWKHI